MMTRPCIAALLLVALTLAACRSEEAPVTYDVRGVYLGPQFNGDAALIDHEAIPGYMEAMRMPFRVEDPALLQELEPETAIAFRLVVKEDGSYIDRIERLPDDALLRLADTPTDTVLTMPAPDSAAAL